MWSYKKGPQNMSSWEAILFLLKGLGGNKCGIYTPADRSTQMIEKWNVVPSLTFMSASKVGHNICKISTGMIHLISNQVLYEPVFCALSSCGFFFVCSFNLSFCFLKVQKFISAEKWVPTGIVAKKWDPGILDPGPFSGQIRKIEARLGKLAKIRKVETD